MYSFIIYFLKQYRKCRVVRDEILSHKIIHIKIIWYTFLNWIFNSQFELVWNTKNVLLKQWEVLVWFLGISSKVYSSDDTALLVDNIIYEIEGLLALSANFLVHFGKNKQKHAWFLSFTTNKIVKIKKIIITFHVL